MLEPSTRALKRGPQSAGGASRRDRILFLECQSSVNIQGNPVEMGFIWARYGKMPAGTIGWVGFETRSADDRLG